jgi:hypothetical protein
MTFNIDITCGKCLSKNISVVMDKYQSGAWEFKCNTCENFEIIFPDEVMQIQIYDYTKSTEAHPPTWQEKEDLFRSDVEK